LQIATTPKNSGHRRRRSTQPTRTVTTIPPETPSGAHERLVNESPTPNHRSIGEITNATSQRAGIRQIAIGGWILLGLTHRAN
jgi:hypothetical protein